MTTKIHAVVDTSGLPVRLALTTGEAHDNRLVLTLLSALKSGAMLLADRGFDADWIRTFVSEHGAWANIPPKRNRTEPICFSATSTVLAIWSSGTLTRSSSVGGSQRAMTSWQQTTLPSSNWHQLDYGCALMSPRPRDFLSVGGIALSTEVPFIFESNGPPSALCSRGFFQGAIVHRQVAATVLMSTVLQKRIRIVRFGPIADTSEATSAKKKYRFVAVSLNR